MYILTGDEKTALWSGCARYPGRVDAVWIFLLDAALSKHSLPRQVATLFTHPHTVANLRLFVGCADTRRVVAGAAISARERIDSAARRATSTVWRAAVALAISRL